MREPMSQPRFFLKTLQPLCVVVLALLLSACASKRYTYRYRAGYTASLENGIARAPDRAPQAVHEAIAAGNRIAGLPYRRGGGHGVLEDNAYDCSGSVSCVLRGAGKLRTSMPSNAFRKYGKSGEGKWITVWARKGHVFVVVAGLRFDTGWDNSSEGPRWTTRSRPARGYVLRHPSGL